MTTIQEALQTIESLPALENMMLIGMAADSIAKALVRRPDLKVTIHGGRMSIDYAGDYEWGVQNVGSWGAAPWVDDWDALLSMLAVEPRREV